jgi:hypothetical protein
VNGPTKFVASLAMVLAFAACNAGGSSSLPGATGQTGAGMQAQTLQTSPAGQRACTDFRPAYMHCEALIQKQGVEPAVAGWGPADFQATYKLPSGTKGAGQVVAIVDAFDNPNVATDLAAYRTNFGLGAANFTKYNQTGQTKNYPPGNIGWGVEIDLDVEMVSAVCPKCTIILIEANDNYTNNLYAAEQEAVTLGAHVVSNSWGGGGGSASGGAFNAAGVTYLASAGDSGYGMQDPADYSTVVSVGGTEISKKGSVYSEVTWPETGGGCSVVTKPSWQHDPKCSLRTGNDVAAVASQAAMYDTYGYGGWLTVGGTSVASPMLGGVYGLAGNASTHQSGKPFWTMSSKKRKKSLHHILTGGVIHCPPSLSGSYLCVAGTTGYKTYAGPVGWGTPNGIGAF